MIYLNAELRAKLEHLVLAGQDEEGRLEWIGTEKQWNNARLMEEALLIKSN
jgi:hypothetical protein